MMQSSSKQENFQNNFTTVTIPSSSSSISASLPSTSTGASTASTSFGHDRQHSVQLKIDASGGPPKQQKTQIRVKVQRNVNFVFSQLIILISQLSPIVQSISALLILLYLVQFSGDITRDFFALTPGEIISPGQWYHTIISLWSHIFLETRWYSLVIDLLILSFCGTLIEPLWGYKEVIRFLLFTCILSALQTAIHYILLYCITTDDNYLFDVRIYGFMPFCAAVLVTVKQLLPQSILIATSFGRLKNDHIPLTAFVLVLVAYFINLLTGVQVIMFSYGICTSWFYLRFCQPHTRHSANSNGSTITTITRGDLSDAFAFETFFPNVLRPLVGIFSATIYNCLVRVGCCPKIASPAVQLLDENSSHLYQNSRISPSSPQPQPSSSSTKPSSFKFYHQYQYNSKNGTLNGSVDNQPLLSPDSVETL